MGELPEKYRRDISLLLLLFNSLGAINEEKAISIRDITEFLNIHKESILHPLKKMIKKGYIAEKNGKYFITRTGIRVVMGLIS